MSDLDGSFYMYSLTSMLSVYDEFEVTLISRVNLF